MLLNGAKAPRFLVADEVGLGKTRVARGVVLEALKRKSPQSKVIVVYITSNAEIARQNARVIRGAEDTAGGLDRLTLLALDLGSMKKRGLYVLAFSPNTSLRFRGGAGTVRERALLVHLLRPLWRIGRGEDVVEIFRVRANADTFEDALEKIERSQIHGVIADRFRAAVRRAPCLKDEFLELRRDFEATRGPWRRQRDSAHLVGRLRKELARASVDGLRQNLLILDEFQRFRWVLEQAMEPEGLVSRLFATSPSLLLSATPYRMRAADGDEVRREFVTLLSFLSGNRRRGEAVADQLEELRESMRGLRVTDGEIDPNARQRIEDAKRVVERSLLRVMSRSERPRSISDEESSSALQESSLEVDDVASYMAFQRAVDRAAAAVDRAENRSPLIHRQTVEYWKSAPYLVNFMKGYKIKGVIEEAKADPPTARQVFPKLRHSPACLRWHQIEQYRPVPANNGRLRFLLEQLEDWNAFRTLWIPPAIPPYTPEGPFAEAATANATKALVFSGWAVVPQAIAALTGYEAEHTSARGEGNSPKDRARRAGRQRLALKVTAGAKTEGTNALVLAYPCRRLAEVVDPYSRSTKNAPGTLSDALSTARDRVREELRKLPRGSRGGRTDLRWYWAAPLLLDAADEIDVVGVLREMGAGEGGRREAGVPQAHLRLAREILERKELGPRPGNLVSVLAEMALAGPGTSALRSLASHAASPSEADETRVAAGRIGWAMRGLLDRTDAALAIRAVQSRRSRGKVGERTYWRDALRYCCWGGLQGVMDEYVALLREDFRHGSDGESTATRIAKAFVDVLRLQPLRIEVDDVASPSPAVGKRKGPFRRRSLSSRFAVPFGAAMTEDSESVHPETVRRAFNSPFWPWVLITTSVGQEGLDFHRYCHSIVHWNVPSTPVELEQREGRVNRFLSHAVRKNIAAAVGGGVVDSDRKWELAVDLAAQHENSQKDGFGPEWVFDGPARVQPVVPVPPSSRDREHYKRVLDARVYYRLVLGQPNPEELVQVLQENLPVEVARDVVDDLRIDLRPPSQ